MILLVNKGTEGWNCPSLFACALARKLKTSNNFVLQAATRCLRQVLGNEVRARVYLSADNFGVLDRQLQETFGETILDLNRAGQETKRDKIVLRKLNVPPLVVLQTRRTVVRKDTEPKPLSLVRPRSGGTGPGLARATYTLVQQEATYRVLAQVGDTVQIEAPPRASDAYAAAVELSTRYRLDLWEVYEELRRIYGQTDIPEEHVDALGTQVEAQRGGYEITEEKVEVALALVKAQGFDKEHAATGSEIYTAEIVYPKDREYLLARLAAWEVKAGGFGFHYAPYNFDSAPEMSFFEQLLGELKLHPNEVEDIYFTGAITDPAKTDFFVEYKDDKGKWRRYTPDFVIRRKPAPGEKSGRAYIVEIKREHDRSHAVDGEKGSKALALQRWVDLNPERLRYQMIFTASDAVPFDQTKTVREFLEAGEGAPKAS